MKGASPPAGSVVCALNDVADGKSRVVTFADGFELIVVRTGDAVFGYANECRHLAVGLNLLDDHACETNAGTILCQYHYATYRFEDGYCIAGPCQGDSLISVPLAVRAGRIVIATGSAAK